MKYLEGKTVKTSVVRKKIKEVVITLLSLWLLLNVGIPAAKFGILVHDKGWVYATIYTTKGDTTANLYELNSFYSGWYRDIKKSLGI